MEVFRDAPAPMISAMCRATGLTRTIDSLLVWDERLCTLSPGPARGSHDHQRSR